MPAIDTTLLDARIAELEIKLGFTEDTVDAMNTTLFRQQQQIDLLTEMVRALRQQMQSTLPGEGHSLRDEIPPHY